MPTVEDDAQRVLADLVGVQGDLDRAFGSREGFVAGEEGEALGVFAQEHGAQVAVAEADLAVVSDGAGDAEGLQADADIAGSFSGGSGVLLDRDRAADGVSPAGVLEGNRLSFFDDGIGIEALRFADVGAFFDAVDAVFLQHSVDLIDAAFITFKQCHFLAS